jgi:HSP20 family protein
MWEVGSIEYNKPKEVYMHIVRWRPSRGLIPWRLTGEPEEWRRNIFDNPFLPAIWQRLPELEKEWLPAIEMFEKEDKFVVKAELPGMKEEDVDVSVTDDMLTIKGERTTENEVNDEDYYCCERSYKASFEDGILDISLPKAVETKPKKVKVERKKKEKTTK